MRFIPQSNDTTILIGEPVELELDVGLALRDGKDVQVAVFSGISALKPGLRTDRVETILKLLSPIALEETSTIRCIGLNVWKVRLRF